MNIQELKSPPKDIKDYKTQEHQGLLIHWKRDVNEIMEKYGYNLVGSGSFGIVYKNYKQNKVVKVFIEDKMYMNWVRFCKKNPNNPWLPKFRSDFIRVKQDPPIYGILIEELEKLSKPEFSYLIQALTTYYDEIFVQKILDKNIGDLSNRNLSIYKVLKNYEKYIEKYVDDDLIKVIEFLIKYSENIDIDSDNVMQRGNQFVIIDPLAD